MTTDQFSDSTVSSADTAADVDQSVASRPARPGAHPFDPISAIFGVLASLSGALVVTGTIDPVRADRAGLWIAGAVISIGVALLPWGRSSRRDVTQRQREPDYR